MRSHQKPVSHSWFRLVLSVCLLSYILTIVPGNVALAGPPMPPLEELSEDQPTVDAQLQASPPALRLVTPTVYLKSRQFQPSRMDALDAQSLQRLANQGQDHVHILVQLDFVPRETARAELAERGLKLLAYVPDYAWIASVPVVGPDAALELTGVTWAGELTVDDKLDPAIRTDEWGSWNLAPDGTAAVYVAMHKDESLETGRRLADAHSGRVTGEVIGINVLIIEMPRDNIRALAAEDAVQWIEPAAPPLDVGNDGIRPQIGVNTVNAAPYSLDGSGIDVLVYDGGQVGSHVDFGTRLTIGAGDSSGVAEHATHVAGTVGGSGANSASQGGSALQWRGMAPGVDIISYGYEWDSTGMAFYDNPGDIELDWARGKNSYGADLGTASLTSNIYINYWSTWCDRMGNYGTTAVLVDQMARGGNSVVGIGIKYISLWCNGNERGSLHSCDTYRTISPPAGAKNPIHVGASNTNNNTMTTFSSWGPTDDGRIKPTIVAGGCQSIGDGGITSTDNNPANDYTVMCGCSMSTPAVAGGVALMLQHYRDVYNTSGTFWPSTAKGILIQTADDFGNPGPDYQWGYGQVDIHAAVDLISRKAFRQESIASGEVDVYYFIVPDNATPATVSLAWDDYEATFNADPTLINNLDLELVAPDGTIWRPWVLDPANPANTATRGTDNRNNQEQVQVFAADEDIVGTWLVRVKGTTVPQGPQDYSLVCEGCKPLNVGVCQNKVSGATMMAAALPEAEGPMLDENGAGDELIPAPALHDAPSAGELWQRSLEARSAAGIAAQTAEREAEIRTTLAAFETAREDGPEAVVALLDTLRGEALDLVMDEIVEAQEQLAEMAPPRPPTSPISLAEEEALLQAQQVTEAANRAQALALRDDPAEGQTQISESANQQAYPARPTADLTVGNGCTYATIGAAITAANPGDTLLIEGGRTFAENLTIPISLTLQGGYNGCASGSTARTTIDGSASNSVIRVQYGLEVTLENLDITNGSTGMEGGGIQFALNSGTGLLNLAHVDVYGNTGRWGGGIWIGQNAEVVGTDVEIYDNTATTYGGGVRLYGGRATFSNHSNIRGNSAPSGSGVYGTLQSGFAPSLSLPSSTDVYDNQALTGDGSGGGVYMREGSLSLAECSDILSNDAIAGGGAYLITSTLTINGSCSEIQNNTAAGDGGGVYAQGSTINLDDQADLYSNDAGTDGTGSGGGAFLDDSNLWSDKASIRFNTADDFGGGVYATNGSIVDMDLGSYNCLGARCSRLSNNTINDFGGGGVYANNSTVDLRNTFIEDNVANLGGGVYAQGSTVYAYNNLFAANNSTGGTGDGVRLYTGSNMSGNGNTLAHNDAGGAGTGQAIGIYNANLTLGCSIIWGHAGSIDLAGQNVTYSDIEGGYAGTGNLDVDPLFVNPAADDYHLQNTSPVIDRCVSGISPDFDNERRPIVRTTAASPYDMGADEASGVDRVGVNGACAYGTIQQAVNAAGDGDTIRVAEGVYFENVDITGGKVITVAGGYDSTCVTPSGGATRIEGSAGSGSTFDIYTNATVALRDLQIAWGSGQGGGVDVYSDAQVSLDNTDVFNNHGSYGGGIYVNTGAVVTIDNDSDIRGNTATVYGGGARVLGEFFGYDNASDIYENCAPDGGGFHVPGGSLYLNNADVYLNQAADASGKGGGIYVTSGGNITLTNSAYVYYLNVAYDGAGIYADDATVYLRGATTTIRDNVATNNGGGVYLTNDSTLRSAGARIGQPGSEIANQAVRGAGIYAIASTVTFDGGSIINNIASTAGGGIYASNSEIDLTDATVGGTGAYEANQLTAAWASGSGLYLTDATQATLSNTVVASNTFQSTGLVIGGGAYVLNDSTLTLINSRVERHAAPLAAISGGLGIAVSNATVILDNSKVLSNTAVTAGGGLYLANASKLDVLGGSSIRANDVSGGAGGGIAATGTSTVTISNSTLQGNTASTNGGAIHAVGNSLVRCDGAEFGASANGNRAMAGSGGALYLSVSTLDAANCTFRNGQATGNGGAIAAYTSTLTIDADYTTCDPLSGQCSTFYSNTADSDDTNGSGDYGGAIFVENSTLQMNHTYLHHNSAWQGGAIYQLGTSASSQVNNTIFYNNTVDSSTGAAIRVGQGGFTVTHVALADNPGIAPAYSAAGGTSNAAHNSIAWGNSSGGFEGTFAIASCNIDQSSNVGIAVDPQFVDPGAGEDYHLLGGSPAIDACTTGLSPDLDNVARPFGSSYDMGAYEYAYSVEFAPDRSGSGEPSSAVTYIHTLTNTGSSSDTYTLEALSSQGWNVTVEPAPTVMLDGGLSTPVTVTINIPTGAPGGAVDTTVVTATSNADPGLMDTVTEATTVEYVYGVEFAPDRSGSGEPSSAVTYIHTLTNTGNSSDTYTLTALSSQGWNVTVEPAQTVMLDVGLSTPVTVTIDIPTGVLSGTVDTTVVTATSNTDPGLMATVTDLTTVVVTEYKLYLPLAMRNH